MITPLYTSTRCLYRRDDAHEILIESPVGTMPSLLGRRNNAWFDSARAFRCHPPPHLRSKQWRPTARRAAIPGPHVPCSCMEQVIECLAADITQLSRQKPPTQRHDILWGLFHSFRTGLCISKSCPHGPGTLSPQAFGGHGRSAGFGQEHCLSRAVPALECDIISCDAPGRRGGHGRLPPYAGTAGQHARPRGGTQTPRRPVDV